MGGETQVSTPYPSYSAWEEDEIDLYELLLVLWKRRNLILGITIFCIFLAGIYILLAPKVYRQTVLLKVSLPNMSLPNMSLPNMSLPNMSLPNMSPSSLWSAEEAKENISQLQMLLREGKWEELARELGLPEPEVLKIVDIQPQTLRRQKNLLKIVFETREADILPAVIKGTVEYLNDNPYLKEKIELWHKTLEQKQRVIERKLKDFEILRNFIISQLQKGKLQTIGFNPLDLDRYIIELRQNLEVLKTQEELLKGVELVSKSPIPKKPYKPKKALILAVAAVSGLFLSIFLAFFVEWFEKAREAHRRKED